MRGAVTALLLVLTSQPARGNDWEKFFKPSHPGSSPVLPATQSPEVIGFSQQPLAVVDAMWRKGYGLMGYSSFNSPNASTTDAVRFATKIKAARVAIATQLTSTRTVDLPISTPASNTSYTSGNMSITGNYGSANGTYNGTTTTYGTQTSHIPITLNRFDKLAIFFGEVGNHGVGLLLRGPRPEEVARYESRHILVITSIRDGSTADAAGMLEGDVITSINGNDATMDVFRAAVGAGKVINFDVVRGEKHRNFTIQVVP